MSDAFMDLSDPLADLDLGDGGLLSHGAVTSIAADHAGGSLGVAVPDPFGGTTAADLEAMNMQHLVDAANAGEVVNPAAQSVLGLIHNTLNASPEQLAHMGGLAQADAAVGGVYNSVAGHEQLIDASNAAHQTIRDADQALIYAQSVLGRGV
jgi:hypothetical protein